MHGIVKTYIVPHNRARFTLRSVHPVTLSFRQLQVIHAILEMGSVTDAAETLGISRPAVSMMLAECTSILGFPLFVRTRGAMVPTDEARALLPELHRLMTTRDDIERLLTQLANVEVGRLVVASVPTLTDHVLPLALSILAERHPNILISVHAMRAAEVADAVQKKRADIGLSMGTSTTEGVQIRSLCSGAVICVLRHDHPLASQGSISPEQLLSSPQISVPRSSAVGTLIDSAFALSGVAWRPQFEVTHASAACAFARAGLGIAVVDPFSAPPRDDPDLMSLRLLPAVNITVQLLQPSAGRPSRAARLLLGAVNRAIDALAGQNPTILSPRLG